MDATRKERLASLMNENEVPNVLVYSFVVVSPDLNHTWSMVHKVNPPPPCCMVHVWSRHHMHTVRFP